MNAPEIAALKAERDALVRQVAAVRALAQSDAHLARHAHAYRDSDHYRIEGYDEALGDVIAILASASPVTPESEEI